MSLRPGMRVLDVGCGVGGPAREIAKFSGVAHITGLNLNEYQVSRANNYAQREGLANRLDFVQGDFMVWNALSPTLVRGMIVLDVADLT